MNERELEQLTFFRLALSKYILKFLQENSPMLPGIVENFGDPRKSLPICTGVLDYFPDALLEVAKVSRVGNDQHNPGEPLHWAREKSKDHPDCILRHLIDRGKLDTDKVRHSAKLAWRALALLQVEIEREREGTRTVISHAKEAL